MNNQWRDNANKMIVWADRSYDSVRVCDMCESPFCTLPVHSDHYKEIGRTVLETKEAQERVDYWSWMRVNKPLGATQDFDGSLVTPEPAAANPDILSESVLRSSGVNESTHEWMQEAYEQLTPKQQEVWSLVMREQQSSVNAAKQLQISKQAVDQILDRAKVSVSNFLRNKQEPGESE